MAERRDLRAWQPWLQLPHQLGSCTHGVHFYLVLPMDIIKTRICSFQKYFLTAGPVLV